MRDKLAFSINRPTNVHHASCKDKWQRMNATKGGGSVMPLVLERHGQGSDVWHELWHCSSSPPGAFVTCTTPQHSGLDVCLGSLSLAQILTGQSSVSSMSNQTDAAESEKNRGWGRLGLQAEGQEKASDRTRRDQQGLQYLMKATN